MNTQLAVIDGFDPEEEITLAHELSEAIKAENEIKKELHTVDTGMEKVSVSYRKYFPQQMQSLAEVEMALYEISSKIADLESENFEEPEKPEPEENTNPEEKKDKKTKKKQVREHYGKISKLCHPDKTAKKDKELRENLTQLFIQAREAYKQGDLELLLSIEVEVTLLLSDRSEQQIKEDRKAKLQALKRSIYTMRNDLDQKKLHPIYYVYDFDKNGQVDQAKAMYAQLMDHLLSQKRAELRELQASLMKKRSDQFWSTF